MIMMKQLNNGIIFVIRLPKSTFTRKLIKKKARCGRQISWNSKYHQTYYNIVRGAAVCARV